MISGALLLGKREETLGKLWKKRILKTVMVLVVFSFLYYVRLVILGYREFNIIEFLKELYSSNWNYTYWYLYSYIGYLMCLPILRSIAASLEEHIYQYLFIIAVFLLGIIPVCEWFLSKGTVALNSDLNVVLFTTQCIIYPLFGYYLEYKVDMTKVKRWIPVFWGVDLGCIFLTCYISYCCYMNSGEFTAAYYTNFVLINCITIYVTFKCYLSCVKSHILEKVVCSIGSATLGIYLLHLMIREWLYDILNYFVLHLKLEYNIAVLVFDIIIFGVGYLLTLILKKIPYIKKIVN